LEDFSQIGREFRDTRQLVARLAGIADESERAGGIATLELLVAAGITPLDVIRIATYNSAVFLGKADQLGSVDTGKLADLVLLSKDPSVDIDNTQSIVFVMKGGQIIDESRLPLAGGHQNRRFSGG
jgi:adenine deaminase